MKKLATAVLMSFISTMAYAQEFRWQMDGGFPQYGSLTVEPYPGTFKARMDINDAAKALNLFIHSENQVHQVSVGFLAKNDGRKTGSGIRTKYLFNQELIENGRGLVFSESSLASGLIQASHLSQMRDTRFQATHVIFGASQYLGARFGGKQNNLTLKAGGEGSGSTLMDDYGALTEWDSYGIGTRGLWILSLSDAVRLRTKADFFQKRYNPARYFFVEKWTTELGFRSELVISPYSQLDLIPAFNYRRMDIERNRRQDLERPEFGGTVMLKNVLAESNIFARGFYAPWRHKKGEETLIAAGIQLPNANIELYQRRIRDVYSTFTLNENITGLQLSWRFGTSENSATKNIDDYGYMQKRGYQFYLDNSIKDNQSLTLSQQSERLDSLRKRNEWSGHNLSYLTATGYRWPGEVYTSRGGDCDEQACFTIGIDQKNSYQGHLLIWDSFRSNKPAHAVELVRDETTNQWFLDEYGMIYKINVDPNADYQTIAREALKQASAYTAKEIPQGDTMMYGIYNGCDRLLAAELIKNFNSNRSRPPIEYGYELFTGKNFLFDYQE